MQTEPSQDEPIDWGEKKKFQKIFTKQAVQSYVFLSFGMGLIAFALPIALVIAGGYDGIFSISYFYYAKEVHSSVGDLPRNILVGCLWATGAFMFLFHGLSKTENRILNVAGIAAILVAMNPTSTPQSCGFHFTIHAASASLFFICLAIVAVRYSKGRLHAILWPPMRRRFEIAYTVAGAAMIVMPAAVALLHFLRRADCGTHPSHWIFWIECFGIWAFSFYWFVKTAEYWILLGIRWHPSPGLRMLWEEGPQHDDTA